MWNMSVQAQPSNTAFATNPARDGAGFLLSGMININFVLGGGVLLSVLFFLLGVPIQVFCWLLLYREPERTLHVLHSTARIWLNWETHISRASLLNQSRHNCPLRRRVGGDRAITTVL